jgi:nitrogen fixation negative regulator NifL
MDITERKQAEKRLRQLSLAVEQSPVSVVITDRQGNMVYVNQKFCEVSGYSMAECLGQNPRILKSGESSPAIYQDLWRCITSGGTWRGEFHNRQKNGELYWEQVVISPLLDELGRVTGFLGVKEDITGRKTSEAALRASEARLAAGTDLAGLGYYEVEYDEGRCFLDARFREICGVPADVQQGLEPVTFWLKHVYADDLQLISQERQKLHDGMVDRIALEYRYQHPTRGLRWLHHSARVAGRSAGGDQVRTFGVIRDITQQKRSELEAQELRNNLTHLARVNTLGALSGSLAHELNQPLGIILSNAQAAQEMLLQNPPDLVEVQAILTDIVAADRRAGEVIERLRALLKRGEVLLRPLSLNQVIEDVLHLTQADLIGRGVTVVRDLALDLPLIAGDRVQLQQLVLNLILNAADAMRTNAPGTRRLQLQTHLQQGWVRASVRDEGSGLAAEPEQLFQPFYTTKPQGLGLGLAICRSIVAAHDGRLWAEAHPERGAIFHFEVPVAGAGDEGGKP